ASHFYRITKGDQQSGYLVLNHFGNSTNAWCDTGTGKIHRFENTQTEAFRFRRKQSDVCRLQIIFNVADIFPHDHPAFESQPEYVIHEWGKIAACENDQLERFSRTNESHRFEQQIDALQGSKIRGMKYQHFVFQAELVSHFFARTLRRTRFKKIVDHFNITAKTEHPLSFLSQKLRYGRDRVRIA